MPEHTERDYGAALDCVARATILMETISERENGENLLQELKRLARDHGRAFEWLVGRKGGLLDQVLAAYPEHELAFDDDAPTAAARCQQQQPLATLRLCHSINRDRRARKRKRKNTAGFLPTERLDPPYFGTELPTQR